jgi:hypothetical protein
MKLVVYVSTDNADSQRLEDLLRKVAPQGGLERVDSIGALTQKLQDQFNESLLAVMVAETREELLSIASFRESFQGVQVVLVLPEQEDELVSIAHRLRPRYITYRSPEYDDLLAVVRRKLNPDRVRPMRAIRARDPGASRRPRRR